jgi:hypothetical protein
MTVPRSVYYRLGLDIDKRILVALERQAVHVISRQGAVESNAPAQHIGLRHWG